MTARLLACWFSFGFIAYQMQPVGEGFATIGAAAIALAINRVWREEQRKRWASEHRRAVIADAELWAAVSKRLSGA